MEPVLPTVPRTGFWFGKLCSVVATIKPTISVLLAQCFRSRSLIATNYIGIIFKRIILFEWAEYNTLLITFELYVNNEEFISRLL